MSRTCRCATRWGAPRPARGLHGPGTVARTGPTARTAPTARTTLAAVLAAAAISLSGCTAPLGADEMTGRTSGEHPWHTGIVATTFWVGEVFDPDADDGTQEYSTYDSAWMASYGGCDGRLVGGVCETEERTTAGDYFPTAMTPLENPFYLDLPYDDLNDPEGFARRGEVIPWAGEPVYRDLVDDPSASLMKNRWVRIRANDRTCYGQIQDAGPGEYHDAAYVFGDDDRRPANTRYNGAGMDVSPALNGCLGFADLNGETDRVDWQFVEASDVPDGPWRRIVTTSGVR